MNFEPPLEYRLSRQQVREVDRIAIEHFGMPGLLLMENAGRNAAAVIEPWVETGSQVAILCGGGNNGGDGYVIARHLVNAGMSVVLIPVIRQAKLKGDAAVNAQIAQRMEMVHGTCEDLQQSHLIVDALLGTGFVAEGCSIRSPVREAVVAINQAVGRVIAIDLPSGLDCDTGQPADVAVKADLTVSFVGSKKGFFQQGVEAYTGKVVVADIGSPRQAIEMARAAYP